MKKYPPWKGIYLAWFSRDFYRDVVKNWHGLGLKYLMITMACFWLLLSLRLQTEVNRFADDFFLPVIRQVPELVLKDDRLKMKVRSPYEVLDPRSGKPIMIFDIREDAPEPPSELDGIFYIGNKQILHYQGHRSEFELKGSWKKPLVTESLIKSLEDFRNWSGTVVFSVFYTATLFLVTLQVFIYGLLGFALSGVLKRPLSFSQTGRVAAAALLPVLTLEFGQRMLGLFFPMWTVASILLAIIYLVFGIRSSSITFNRPELSPELSGSDL